MISNVSFGMAYAIKIPANCKSDDVVDLMSDYERETYIPKRPSGQAAIATSNKKKILVLDADELKELNKINDNIKARLKPYTGNLTTYQSVVDAYAEKVPTVDLSNIDADDFRALA